MILLAACLAQFMTVLDVSVVNVALPAIQDALGFGDSGLTWVANGYSLAFGGCLLLGGRCADLFGHRRVFLAGVAVFGAASLLAGAAPGPGWLVAARVLQGLGGAVLSPATLAIVTTTFTGERARRSALGTWSAVGAVGGAAGGLLGGALVRWAGWRWIFLINVPIALAIGVIAVLFLARTGGARERPRLDVVGAALATGALVSLVYGATRLQDGGAAYLPFLLAIGLFAAFVRTERRSAAPLVPPGTLLRRPGLTINLTMAVLGCVAFTTWYFGALFLQRVAGLDAWHTGLAFLPQAACIIAGARLAGRLPGRIPPKRIVLAGTVCVVAGLGWYSTVDAGSAALTGVVPPGMLVTFGLGLSFGPLAALATGAAAEGDTGLAAGLLSTFRQIGAALGLAGLAWVAHARSSGLTASGTPAAAAEAAGFGRAFLVAAVLAAAATALAAAIPGGERRG
ncbi:MFS transporter [Amycolatopsis sp. Hca4]|uniref:MFS transporter n=1 Tax=Amycolatopsis sp. Hca4 TaxID=2742131 RepID=UPI0026DEB27A|nr:MFS transporter [Amycolatopsis sp. Hca4]